MENNEEHQIQEEESFNLVNKLQASISITKGKLPDKIDIKIKSICEYGKENREKMVEEVSETIRLLQKKLQ